MKLFRVIYVIIILFSSATFSLAANKTFTGPGNFSDPTKWNGGTLPAAGDNLTIRGSCVFDNNALSLQYNTLTLGVAGGGGTSGTISWPALGTNTLNVSAVSSARAGSSINMSNGGFIKVRASWSTNNLVFVPGIGTFIWNVITANSSLPLSTFYNLVTETTGRQVSLGSNTNVSNVLTVLSGTFSTSNRSLSCGDTLNVFGVFADNSTSGNTSLKEVVVQNGGAISSSSETYNINGSLTMLGGSFVGSGTPRYNIANEFKVLSGVNNISRAQISVSGLTTISGVLNINSVNGTKTFNDFIVTTSGSFNVSVSEAFTINGNIQVDGIFNANLGVYTFAGLNKTISGTTSLVFDDVTCNGTYTNFANVRMISTFRGTGTWTQGNTGIVDVACTNANFSITTFNASNPSNTVIYSRAGTFNVRIPNDGDYHHLTISGSNTKSLINNTLVNGNLTINVATLDVTASNFSITVGGNWSDAGVFTPRAGTVIFSSTSPQTIFKNGGETFNHISFSGSGIKSLLSPISANNFLINTGSSFDVSATSHSVTIRGNYTNDGTFNTRTGLVFFNGTVSQSIGGTSTTSFYDLTLNNNSGAVLNANINLRGTMLLNNGIFNVNGQAFTMISNAANTARIGPLQVLEI